MEATWTPNEQDTDGGGPLPLSQAQREQLLQLEKAIAQSPNPQETLRLLTNITERVPNILCKTAPNLIGIFQAATSPACTTPEIMAALTETICYVAIATQAAASGKPDVISFLSSTCLDHLTVDSNSPAAQLGTACLLPLLPMMQQAVSQQDALHSCLQYLAHAATTCPSLLAGDVNVFSALVRTCLQIATTSGSELALSACQVLASLCAVGYIKRRILLSHADISHVIKNDVLRVCAELSVNEVDHDIEEWASEPGTIIVCQMDCLESFVRPNTRLVASRDSGHDRVRVTRYGRTVLEY